VHHSDSPDKLKIWRSLERLTAAVSKNEIVLTSTTSRITGRLYAVLVAWMGIFQAVCAKIHIIYKFTPNT